jgi:O-methyltransferase
VCEAKSGDDFFATLYADPERLAQFARGMSGLSAAAGRAIAAKFPWRDYRSVIDIGCSEGAVAVAITLAHGHLTGGGFDLPPMQPLFDAYAARSGVADRLSCGSPVRSASVSDPQNAYKRALAISNIPPM